MTHQDLIEPTKSHCMWYDPPTPPAAAAKGNHKQHINSFNKINIIFLSKKINILYIYMYIFKDFLWPTTSHGWSILFWVRFDCSTFISYFQHTSFVSQALFFSFLFNFLYLLSFLLIFLLSISYFLFCFVFN